MLMLRGPRRGAEGGRPRIPAHLMVAFLAVLVYALLQLPMPTQAGPDAGYYLLGCEHIASGQWPWGSEPPLAFLLLYPFTLVLPATQAFTVLSSILAGLAIYLMGELCGRLAAAVRPFSRSSAALLGAVLCLGYMSPGFMIGLLKNQVANVLVIAVVLSLVSGNLLRSSLFLILASTAHPGIAITLVAALAATVGLSLAGQGITAVRNGLNTRVAVHKVAAALRGKGWRLVIWLVLPLVGLAVAAPTVSRYLTSYLRDVPPRGAISAVFQWDAAALFARYLPLWIPAAIGFARLSSSPPRAASRNCVAMSTVALSVWIVVLLAMASTSGLTSRRFEVQMFAPIVAIAGAEMALWLGPERVARVGPRLMRKCFLVLAPVFGLVLVAATLVGAVPLLSAPQVEALSSFDSLLPEDARIFVHASYARYWVEYYARRSVLSPFFARERLGSPGPVYMLSENPTAYGKRWPTETLSALAARGLVIADRDGLLLLEARWNQAFFDTWRDPLDEEAVAALLDVQPTTALTDAGRLVTVYGVVAGWVLCLPLGVARVSGLSPALATAVGLPLTVCLWWCVASVLLVRAKGARAKRASTATAAISP